MLLPQSFRNFLLSVTIYPSSHCKIGCVVVLSVTTTTTGWDPTRSQLRTEFPERHPSSLIQRLGHWDAGGDAEYGCQIDEVKSLSAVVPVEVERLRRRKSPVSRLVCVVSVEPLLLQMTPLARDHRWNWTRSCSMRQLDWLYHCCWLCWHLAHSLEWVPPARQP